jgi:uridine phosphorylase
MKNQSLQKNNSPIHESELIITEKGKIYHLNLHPDEIAENIILVGDPARVSLVSGFFSNIECKIENREFITHTGYFNSQRISVVSTGIGTDNIDIVINELDALFNIDLNTRYIKDQKKSLNLIRIGTSGSLQENIEVDSFVASAYALGLDGIAPFYKAAFEPDESDIQYAFIKSTSWQNPFNIPYVVKGSNTLLQKIAADMHTGITATANGFYGPQGRVLRLPLANEQINSLLNTFNYKGLKICNYEMETSALYFLSGLLGHQAATVCAIIANRYKHQYSKNYHDTVKKLVETVLNRLTV